MSDVLEFENEIYQDEPEQSTEQVEEIGRASCRERV